MFGFFNPYYMIFMAPALVIMLAAQWYVSSTIRKWNRVPSRNGLSGAESAERLIRSGGLRDVRVEGVRGRLSDHYDPRHKLLRLSAGVYQGKSVAALAIAAHELGHAMQDKDGYFPLRFRAMMVPAVNFGSMLGWAFILFGLLLRIPDVAWIGVFVFSLGAVFALVTLPVEFNASARAKELLTDTGIIVTEEEKKGVNAVLNAAALTYVAALITAVLQLLYYILLVGGMGRRRR